MGREDFHNAVDSLRYEVSDLERVGAQRDCPAVGRSPNSDWRIDELDRNLDRWGDTRLAVAAAYTMAEGWPGLAAAGTALDMKPVVAVDRKPADTGGS